MDVTTKPTTDPGLGPRPPSDPPPPPSKGRSYGVIVPPPSDRSAPNPNAITPPEFAPISRSLTAPPSLSKDSVELLLEGMTGPRPDRRKTMPQSDGEASAAYHAEHGLRPARSSSEPGPKVVVERPVPPAAPSRPRPVITVPGRVQPGSREALSTFVPGRVLRRRVAMAILAGVLIVLLSFMGLRLSEERRAVGPAPATPDRPAVPTATAEAPAPPTRSVTASGPVEPAAVPPTPTVNPEPPAPAATHASTSGTTRHHHTPSEAPSAAPTGDLGEFKARF